MSKEMFQQSNEDAAQILTEAVNRYSSGIYKNFSQLEYAMQEAGAGPRLIQQVKLMVLIPGFDQLCECSPATQQADIDRYVKNALEESGLNRETVLELTGAIAISMGIPCVYHQLPEQGALQDGRYVIPYCYYEKDLAQFEEVFRNHPELLTNEDMERVTALANAGIPKAQYDLACCIRYFNEEGSSETAMEYLEAAAASGSAEAAVELGDYYYEKKTGTDWEKALKLYTSYGSPALNSDRRHAVVNILNSRSYNGKMCITSLVLAVILLLLMGFLTLYVFPAAKGFLPLIAAAGLMVCAVAAGFVYHKLKPYHSMMWLPCTVSVIWLAFMVYEMM